MRSFLAALIALSLAPALAVAGDGWNLYDPDGSYQGRISREPGGTLDRFGADGSYQGRYDRQPDGWNAYDAQGRYQGRISGQGDRDLPAVIGADRP